MKFVCPQPESWAKVHSALTRAWEGHGRKGPPPPVPLILNGWVFTNDLEKAKRWEETALWARDSNVEHIVSDLRDEEKYCIEEFTTYEVGPRGGPMYLPWSFDTKPVPNAEKIRAAIATLSKDWTRIVGLELGRMTKPLRFTGKKKRRLVVRADEKHAPPWGGWNALAPGENRRAFTHLRSAINRAISPLEVDHIDFEPSANWSDVRENDGE